MGMALTAREPEPVDMMRKPRNIGVSLRLCFSVALADAWRCRGQRSAIACSPDGCRAERSTMRFIIMLLIVAATCGSAAAYERKIINDSVCLWHVSGDSLNGSISFGPFANCTGLKRPLGSSVAASGYPGFDLSPFCQVSVMYSSYFMPTIGHIRFSSGNYRASYGWTIFAFDPRGVWIQPGGTTPYMNMNEPDSASVTIFGCPGQHRHGRR
jgi:hypothetical protein